MKKVILFLDGFPFYHGNQIADVLDMEVAALVPGLGFSSNQHCYLLGGKSPDDAGFFTDWTLRVPVPRSSRYVGHKNVLGYVLNKILGRLRGYTHAIPLGLHHAFINENIYPLKSTKSLVDFNSDFEGWAMYIDDEAFEFLEGSRVENKTFLVINSIDGKGHYSGTKSEDYSQHMNEVLRKVRYLSKANDVDLLIFSDHGMSVSPKPYNLYLEDYFGRQGSQSYFYFVDSTTLKLWIFSPKLKESIREFLESTDRGVVLSESDREKFGVSNREFGDIIFVLHNDFYFLNQYFGRGWKSVTKGMHGNWPDHKEQHGIYALKSKEINQLDTSNFYTDILKPFLCGQ